MDQGHESKPMPAPTTPARGVNTHAFQAPTGTRDFYPAELSRLRYIQNAWRQTAINHGFDEIDGPTFEHLELYEKKSGEGIISELFSFERFGGEKKFALRPEFTPTLARMYASKASAMPKPTKWFWQQNCYRAERPQRGRLREFCQWNCDILGEAGHGDMWIGHSDAECVATCVGLLESLGLGPEDVRVKVGHRATTEDVLVQAGVSSQNLNRAFSLLDGRSKMSLQDFSSAAQTIELDIDKLDAILEVAKNYLRLDGQATGIQGNGLRVNVEGLLYFSVFLKHMNLLRWVDLDLTITRGLAYYTGMVFEVHEASGAERAIAGGGRYDNLIELFGGPPTPAVGFGMGDVVLSLVLQDKGLFPDDAKIADELGLRPDAFVIAFEDKSDAAKSSASEAQIAPTLAALRRAGLHARRSYKSTKNVGKLLQDAVKARARFAIIIESETTAQIKNLDTQQQETCELAQVVERVQRALKA